MSPADPEPTGLETKPFAVITEKLGGSEQFTRVQALSMALHVAVLTLLIAPVIPVIFIAGPTQAGGGPQVRARLISPFVRHEANSMVPHGGGGGGDRDARPATVGKLPPFAILQLAPPSAHPPDAARLSVTPTIDAAPDLQLRSPDLPKWGDPLARVNNDSNGPGHDGGMGPGEGTGIGPGDGPGYGPGKDGGFGDGVHAAGEPGYGDPVCVYCPNPQFTDEAVKAKYQGSVYLSVVVTPDGRATNIRVEKGLGMGLDERAIETVKTWRFQPALGPDGKPAAVGLTVELTFRLY